jgi:4'-phosphopantetheinyl transferase
LKSRVAVWSASLQQPEAVALSLSEFLSPDEQERADRFRFEHLRVRFRTGRGILRSILGSCLSVPPQSLQFAYTEQGKPFLPGNEIYFNLSHTGDQFLCGISTGAPLGVDVEGRRRIPDLESIAARFFSPEELQSLLQWEGEERVRGFYRCWTRKEAFLKATGEGLSRGLHTFQVTLSPDEPASLLQVDGSVEEARQWTLFSLEPAEGFTGAVAIRVREAEIIQHHWNL